MPPSAPPWAPRYAPPFAPLPSPRVAAPLRDAGGAAAARASPAHVAAAAAAASEATLAAGVDARFTLGRSIVGAAPLAVAFRRGDRVLPGRSDSSVAAAHVLGGTPDAVLAPLLESWDVGGPRAARVKRAEAVWKQGVKESIAELNGCPPTSDSRAENLAALRVCESVVDVLDGHVVRTMADLLRAREAEIADLRRRVAELEGRLPR